MFLPSHVFTRVDHWELACVLAPERRPAKSGLWNNWAFHLWWPCQTKKHRIRQLLMIMEQTVEGGVIWELHRGSKGVSVSHLKQDDMWTCHALKCVWQGGGSSASLPNTVIIPQINAGSYYMWHPVKSLIRASPDVNWTIQRDGKPERGEEPECIPFLRVSHPQKGERAFGLLNASCTKYRLLLLLVY